MATKANPGNAIRSRSPCLNHTEHGPVYRQFFALQFAIRRPKRSAFLQLMSGQCSLSLTWRDFSVCQVETADGHCTQVMVPVEWQVDAPWIYMYINEHRHSLLEQLPAEGPLSEHFLKSLISFVFAFLCGGDVGVGFASRLL